MASVAVENKIWNAFIHKNGNEPINMRQFHDFSIGEDNPYDPITFKTAAKIFQRNKHKGKIKIEGTTDMSQKSNIWKICKQSVSKWFVPQYYVDEITGNEHILMFPDFDDEFNAKIAKYNVSKDEYDILGPYNDNKQHQEMRIAVNENKQCVYIVGGKKESFEIYDIKSGEVESICIQNERPKFGSYPSLYFINDKEQLHIIGGTNNGKHYLLNKETHTVDIIHDFGYKQMYGQGIAYCYSTKTLFVFGGEIDGKLVNTMLYNTNSTEWKKCEVPFTLEGFGFTTYNDEYIIVIGGRSRSRFGSDKDVWYFNMVTFEWKCKTNLCCPIKGSFHASMTRDGYIHLFEYDGKRNHYSIHISSIVDHVSQQIIHGYMRMERNKYPMLLIPNDINDIIRRFFGSMDIQNE
eukprot:202271_1